MGGYGVGYASPQADYRELLHEIGGKPADSIEGYFQAGVVREPSSICI